MSDKRKVDENEVVVLCPIDVDAELFFFETFKELEQLVRSGARLALIAIKPEYPSDQFAYILPEKKTGSPPAAGTEKNLK